MTQIGTATDGQSGASPVRLGTRTLSLLNKGKTIRVPGYMAAGERDQITPGLVVLGASNIARSLICRFMELACEHGQYKWGVSVVSTRTPDVVNALNEQDCLFASVEKSQHGTVAVLNGVICEALFAKTEHQAVMKRLCSPDTSVVILTVTENGYYLRSDVSKSDDDFRNRKPADWLDAAKEEIAHDILNPRSPKTIIGYLVEALRKRREQGIEPFTVISCDNLPKSGMVAKNVVIGFAEEVDTELAVWIDREVDFCDSVVDRITPAERLEESQQWLWDRGVHALRPVTCEPYARLIIGNNWRRGLPEGWLEAGVEFMTPSDLDAWRQVKQRLLNGSHVNLAIAGNLVGYEYVHEAIGDEHLRALIGGFMMEAKETLVLPPGFESTDFIEDTLTRFDNSALPDNLSRVGRYRGRKVTEHVLHTAARQIGLNGSVDKRILQLTSLWVYSMISQNYHLFEEFPEGDLHKVHEMCQSMWDAAKAGNCHLVASALKSRTTFPKVLREDEQFANELCASLAKLASLTPPAEEMGWDNARERVANGVREFVAAAN